MEPIFIVGAGGIGCAVGYALAEAGVPVAFVEADLAKLEWGKSHGVCVDGRPAMPASFLSFDEWSPAPHSTVLLCTKCYDNPAALARLPESVTLVPIQNGFDPLLESRRPEIEGIASFVSECLPGKPHTRITRQGKLHLGRAGSVSPLNTSSRDVRSPIERPEFQKLRSTALFHVEFVPDILPYKYAKLMYNAAISPIAAAAGIDNGQLLSIPQARRLFFDLLRENYCILKNAGIPLARIGPFHPRTVNRILSCRPIARAFAWAFQPTLRGTYCSMSGDLPRGRTEIENYNGHLLALANGTPCPLNRSVYDLVKRIERERTKPGLEALEALATTASAH